MVFSLGDDDMGFRVWRIPEGSFQSRQQAQPFSPRGSALPMRACTALQSFLSLRKIRRSRLAGESKVLAAFYI